MKHLLSVLDLDRKDIASIIAEALRLKKSRRLRADLDGKTIGIVMEKPSTRTTVSFAVAAHDLGALPIILSSGELQRKRGETVADTARTLSRYLDAVAYRTFAHSDIEEYAANSSVPVINALTDKEHPCQALGDLLTIIEKKNPPERLNAARLNGSPASILSLAKKTKITFVGDGNNVLISWLYLAASAGLRLTHACPAGFEAPADVREKTAAIASKTGAEIIYTDSADKAVEGAGVVYTDVWTSMGSESQQEIRKKAFAPYRVDSRLLGLAAADAIVMHCLPARRGEEITDEVMDGPRSVVFDQAENRLHIQKAILLALMK